MRFKNKNILVIGAARSGIAAAQFLVKKEASVTIYDDKPDFSLTIEGTAHAINQEDIMRQSFDLVVLSPGISINHPIAKAFSGKIVNEMQIGLTSKHKKSIAVTGTNGKTSVVNMITSALNYGRQKKGAVLIGNSGRPVTDATDEIRKKTPVIEVSSFMLEPTFKGSPSKKLNFRPKIAAVLNITQDHLERHGTMENYINHKAAITKNQRKRDFLILNYDCPNARQIADKTKARVLFFSTFTRVRGIYLDGDDIILNTRKKTKKLLSLKELEITSLHEVQNFLATALICKLIGCKTSSLQHAKADKSNRIEFVANSGTLAFYNDSKATNIAATLAACRSFNTPTHLLVGGVAKGQNFSLLFKHLPKNVTNVFAFGEAKEELLAAAEQESFENIESHEDMRAATLSATQHGTGQRVILLSPSCSSFDQFEGYEDRGRKFVEIVNELTNRNR